jgi:hypothetical protein
MEIYVITPVNIFLEQRLKHNGKITSSFVQHATHLVSPMPNEFLAWVKPTETPVWYARKNLTTSEEPRQPEIPFSLQKY